MAPPSGRNLICKNPTLPDQHNQSKPKGVSEKCISVLCICCWQPASLTQYLLRSAPPPRRRRYRYIQAQAQTVNDGGEQTTTKPKNAPPLPTSKRRNKKTDEEKQCKNKELDHAREKTRINIEASFQRWRVLQDF